jgi:phosphoserine phosphatase
LERVIGLRLRIVDGQAGPTLTDTIVPPLTMAASKINAAWVATGRRPAFAIGDSPWDTPLLLHAHSRLGIARIAGLL